MYTVKGSYRQGVVRLDVPVSGREGQAVLITFIESDDAVADVARSIKMMGKNPDNIEPSKESLLDLLADVPDEEPIDSELWNAQWAGIEQHMKERDQIDDRSEGRY